MGESNIYQKIAKARQFVAQMQAKAEGKLGSRGVYYTPEQVYNIATQAEEYVGLVCLPLKLEQTEQGFVGTIQVIDLEDKQRIEVSMITDTANIIKASPVQNMGGTYTYTERYLLSSLFRIRSTSTVDVDSKNVESFPIERKRQISKEEFERKFKK